MTRAIQAVSFDAGGTLIEPWPSVGAVYASVAREFGLECCPDRLRDQFQSGWRARASFNYTRDEWHEVVRQSFGGMAEVSKELFDAIYERFARPESWLIYDDVIPTLQRLEQRGLKRVVISNWDERLPPLLQRLGLAAYFDDIVVSSALGIHKPDPRIFLHAAEQIGVSPENILHIGDIEREDLAGARSAGMIARRVRRSAPESEWDIVNLTEIAL